MWRTSNVSFFSSFISKMLDVLGTAHTLVVGSNQQRLKSSRCQCRSSPSNPSQTLLYSQETSPRGDVLHCWLPEHNWGVLFGGNKQPPPPALSSLCSRLGEIPLLYMKIGRVQADRQISLCSSPLDPVLE